jgi:hypothetical protein
MPHVPDLEQREVPPHWLLEVPPHWLSPPGAPAAVLAVEVLARSWQPANQQRGRGDPSESNSTARPSRDFAPARMKRKRQISGPDARDAA